VKPWQSLSSRKEFLRTLKAGKRAEGGSLFLRLLPAGPGRKIGFSTRKGFKNAVHRNRAKRWMREAVRKNIAFVPDGANLILVAKPGMQAGDFSSVADEVRRLLRELS
jgi:ribonuclease P protein component